jgi:high-affinity K+ transport system ATPase subunit B
MMLLLIVVCVVGIIGGLRSIIKVALEDRPTNRPVTAARSRHLWVVDDVD